MQYYVKSNIDNHTCSYVQKSRFMRCTLFTITIQGSKLTLANSQNVSDFDKLQVEKNIHYQRFPSYSHPWIRSNDFRISLRWLIHIINSVDKTKLSCLNNIWKEFSSGLTSLLVETILLAKLSKWIIESQL